MQNMADSKIRVIGAVGQNGTGKDEVLKYLKQKYDVPFIATGDIVREIAVREHLELNRENLGNLSERYFKEFGRGCFVKMAADKIRENGWNIAGISGVRTPDDVRILRETFAMNFVLIRVFVTDPKVRYSRMVARGEGRDPKSYEQFLQQDKNEEACFSVQEVEAMADYSVANDGTLDDLHRAIDRLVDAKGLKGLVKV
jgi:dephospho-CoA kinase